jgi:ribonuclease HII
MDWRSLNEIEAMKIGFLLNNLKQKPVVVFVDAPDIIEANFAKRIKKYLSFDTVIRSEHKADVNYPIVSSASIIAKVERDKRIEELAEKFGCVGSGYSHDPLTIAFLKKWMKDHKELPPFARRAWDTNKRIEGELFQKKLF